MESRVLTVRADRQPMAGVDNPGPHQIYRNPRVSVETRDLGELHPDEMRVEMIYAGVCGTDVHLVTTDPDTGYIRCSAPARSPEQGRVIGHEGVGRVLAVGSRVRHVRPGAHVTFESIIVCHYCDRCRSGHFNQCRRARLLGLEKDGLFGTVVDVPSMLSHDVSSLSDSDEGLRAAACVEPAGVAYVACQNTHVSGGDVVVVFGCGPIGLFAAMLSGSVFGAGEVHLVEPRPSRRKFAAARGLEVRSVQDFFKAPPRQIDVVIEASGDINNINRAFRRLNANAHVALLGRSGLPLQIDAVDHMITNQITIVGSRGHLGGAFSSILSLYRNGRLDLCGPISSVIGGLDELASALREAEDDVVADCKVLLRLDS